MVSRPERKIDAFHEHEQPHPGGERCPLCDQPLPQELSADDLQARLHEMEQQAARSLEAKLRARFAQELTTKIDEAKKQERADAAKREKEIRTQAKNEVTTELRATIDKAHQEKAKAEEDRKAAQAQVKELKESHDERVKLAVTKALSEQREALENDKAEAIQKAKAEDFRKAQRLEKQVNLLKRQLEEKTAEAIGEGAEVDLFETLSLGRTSRTTRLPA